MRTAASIPYRLKPVAAAVPNRAFNPEYWLVFAMLLATTIFPEISKYKTGDGDSTMSSPIAQVTWSVMYLVAAMRLYAYRARTFTLLGKSALIVTMLVYLFVSTLWSVAPTTTLYNAIELVGTVLIAYYIVVRFTLLEFLKILALLFATVGLVSLVLIFVAPGHARMGYGSGAWTGIFQEKNNLAAAMSLGIIGLFVLMLRTGWRGRLWSCGALALCVVLLLGSKSATATTGTLAAIGVIVLGMVFRSRRIGTGGRFAIVFAVLLAVGTIWALGLTPGSFLGVVGRDANLTGRTDFWPYLEQAILDRPIFGYGYDAFFRSAVGANYLSYYVVEAGGWSPYHSHNSFLQALLDGGVVALGLLVGILGVAVTRGAAFLYREKDAMSTWPLAIVVYLVAGSFTETYLNQFNTFEMIFFVAALLYPIRATMLAKESERAA